MKFRKVLALAMFLLFSHFIKFYGYASCCTTCIDLSKGTTGLYALLQSMWPSHTIIRDGGCTVINAGGSYQMMQNVEGCISIEADDVIVDLNGFTLFGQNGPMIAVAAGKKNIMIKNGSLEGIVYYDGVSVLDNASTIVLENLHISNCNRGMYFLGVECEPITCCRVDNCITTSCVRGYVLEFTEKTVFENCEACCCQESGFELESCRFNKFKDCMAIGIGNADPEVDAFGFTSLGGFDNLFYECFAEGIHKDGGEGDGTWCNKAIGFNFGFTFDNIPERESKIVKCLVDSVSTPTCSWYHAMGIRLDAIFPKNFITIPGAGGSFLTAEHIPVCIDWSPQCNLIAFGEKELENGSGFKLIKFDGSTPLEIDAEALGEPLSLQFSPNGRFILFTRGDGAPDLSIYDVEKRMVVATADEGIASPYARWLNCGNKIILSGTGGISFFVYAFDGSNLNRVRAVPDIGFVVGNLSISPDDKIMAASDAGTPNNIRFVDLNSLTPTGILLPDVGAKTSFNPVVCCGKYYLASLDSENTLHVSFYNAIKEETQEVAILESSGDDQIRDFKWHPTGKYLAVARSGESGAGLVVVYRFDPQAEPVLGESFAYDGTLVNAQNYLYIDWSPCGNYLVILGEPKEQDSDIDFEIIEVGDCVKCCVVDRNKVANCSGGQCAIGIFGTSCCNGVTRNVSYGNCVNFSQGVFNKYCNGLSGPHSLLGNWSIPPY